MRQRVTARAEAGSGLFASAFGLLFFLGFLLVASEAMLTLQRASAVRAVAFDAAHAAAEADRGGARSCGPATEAEARGHVAAVLGAGATSDVTCIGQAAVRVTVEARAPMLVALVGPGTIRRSAEVRFEAARVAG